MTALSSPVLSRSPPPAQTVAEPAAMQDARRFQAEGLAFEVTCAATLRSAPIKGRVYVFLGPDEFGRRAAVRARLVPAAAVFRRERRELEAGRAVANRFRVGWIPRSARRARARADMPSRPSSGSTSTRTRSATARETRTARSSTPSSIPKKGARSRSKVDQLVEPRPFTTTERIKLVELPSPKLSAFHHRPIKHRAAVILPEGMSQGDHDASCRRSTSSPASAATTSWPRASPRVRGWPSARISSGWCSTPTAAPAITSSPTARPTARAGTALVEEFIPLHRADVPGARRSPRPLAQRPFLGRLEQPLAPGDLSRRLRRHLVDQPRPGRFPRLSADQPLRRRREHVPRPRRQAPADRPDGSHARALLRPLLAGWTT